MPESVNCNEVIYEILAHNAFGEEMTLAELQNAGRGAIGNLYVWLADHYNATGTNEIRYDAKQNFTDGDMGWFSVGYDDDLELMYLDLLYTFDDGTELYVVIWLDSEEGNYWYYFSYEESGIENETQGEIRAQTYTKTTILTPSSFEGGSWNQSSLMSLYGQGVNLLLNWYQSVNTGVTLGDLGFVSYAA